MANWLPAAKRIKAWQDGGTMLGGPRRVVWHTTENNPNKTSSKNLADYLNRVGYQPHLIWNPVSGEIIQMIPANRAGRALRNAAGGVQTNRAGSICVQIEVVGQAAHPFTDGPMKGRELIIEWLRSLGIPDVWPGGPPPKAPKRSTTSARTWDTEPGHYGHSQVPENDHHDPGGVDVRKLLGVDTTPAAAEAEPLFPGYLFRYPPYTRGHDVAVWQEQMNRLGYDLEADGVYGPASEAAARDLQRIHKLKVDGVVGPDTWSATWEKM